MEDAKSSDNEQDEKEGGSDEEIYAKHGTVGEHEEKPEDDLDNYFLPGEDVLEVSCPLGMILRAGYFHWGLYLGRF